MTMLVRDGPSMPPIQSGSVVSIGNFDGIHVGHQALLTESKRVALALNLPAWTVWFEPPPQVYFRQRTWKRLMSFRDKFEQTRQLGIDGVWCLRFNAALAQLSAEQFVHQVLLRRLQARRVLVGDDFRFGHQRSGGTELLVNLGAQAGFSVDVFPAQQQNAQRVSSTLIRQALTQGDLVTVRALLGRHYTLSGRVMYGAGRGRHLGWPTANVSVSADCPLAGVYVTEVQHGQHTHQAVANVGRRPTVDGERLWLEVHLFDFQGTLYGQRIRVHFYEKIRSEQRFSSLDDLKAQIQQDAKVARDYFIAATAASF